MEIPRIDGRDLIEERKIGNHLYIRPKGSSWDDLKELASDISTRAKNENIECWLSWQNRTDELRLPVTPYWEISKPKNNQTATLFEKGDISMSGNDGLRSFSIETFLPHKGHRYSFCPRDTDEPYSIINLLNKWQDSPYPIRVIWTNTPINIACLINNITISEPDGSRDVYIKLDLTEYVFTEAMKLATSNATNFETAVAKQYADRKEWPVEYGDTLTGISIAKFGDASHVDDIYEWNKDLITNKDSLKNITRQVLKLEPPK